MPAGRGLASGRARWGAGQGLRPAGAQSPRSPGQPGQPGRPGWAVDWGMGDWGDAEHAWEDLVGRAGSSVEAMMQEGDEISTSFRVPRGWAAPCEAGGADGGAPPRGVENGSGGAMSKQQGIRLAGTAATGFLWSMGSLMVYSVLPVFMREELGISNTRIGLLEGTAIFCASSSKVLAGVASDAFSRVAVIAVGAAITLLVKPMFAVAPLLPAVVGTSSTFLFLWLTKILDRVAKGVRGAPTDALLSDLSGKRWRGRAFALNQSASTMGGVLGTFAASTLMLLSRSNHSVVFAAAFVPAALAMVILLKVVWKEPTDQGVGQDEAAGQQPEAEVIPAEDDGQGGGKSHRRMRLGATLGGVRQLSPAYWLTVIIVGILYTARFSETFIALRARSIGWPTASLPLLFSANHFMQSLLTFPMGVIADKAVNKHVIVGVGMVALMCANLVFINVPNVPGTMLGFALVGLHMSMSQSNLKALVSESVPSSLRGTAFSFLALINGVALLSGNFVAGRMMDWSMATGRGMTGAFYGGLVSTVTAFAVLVIKYYAIDRGQAPKPAAEGGGC